MKMTHVPLDADQIATMKEPVTKEEATALSAYVEETFALPAGPNIIHRWGQEMIVQKDNQGPRIGKEFPWPAVKLHELRGVPYYTGSGLAITSIRSTFGYGYYMSFRDPSYDDGNGRTTDEHKGMPGRFLGKLKSFITGEPFEKIESPLGFISE